MHPPINTQTVARYLDGEEFSQDEARRIEAAIVADPQLRALATLLSDSFDDEDFEVSHAGPIEARVNDLWNSRVAVVRWDAAEWPGGGGSVTGTAKCGTDVAVSLKAIRRANTLALTGDWSNHVRPLSLLWCDYDFVGKDREKKETSGWVRWDAPRVAQAKQTPTGKETTKPTRDLAAQSALNTLRGDSETTMPPSEKLKYVEFAGDRLDVGWFPRKDKETNREILIAECSYRDSDGATRKAVEPFEANRVANKDYMVGSTRPLAWLSDVQGTRVDVKIRPMAAADWPHLVAVHVSLMLSTAHAEPFTLKPVESGYELALPVDSQPSQMTSPNATWLLRYTEQKGGK